MLLRVDGRLASQGLNPSDASGHRTFAFNAKGPNGTGGRHVNASAQLFGRTKFNHPHCVTVLLPKQHHRPSRLCVGNGHVAVFLARMVGQDAALNQRFDSGEFVVRDFLEVRKVKAQPLGFHK